ncbi:tyrosine-protein phosphatase [Aeromicrobium wangtongii]|uniref:Tyrosine-protein phosphatase n=1 Tax=Aeromicrobium wangtongii TaxID=2969247 RepID=A0ABY5MAN1_9ACTN|nr:tyrosine-protein phosphatase [Aeromicrobium wangtongii]MCD9197700.1 tyrosine-protein phosphatase [Aeromicrobium wangtongii]UUP15184.1 tyrosine-protein phosphatase [Aeromicrobium wangtongii]
MTSYAGPEGTLNFRAVGALPTTDGRTVIPGKLFRSDTLQFLSAEAVRHFVEDLGIRTIIDLRMGYELKREGRGPLEGTALSYHHLPFTVEGTSSADSAAPVLDPEDPIVPHYLGYLTTVPESVAGVFNALASGNDALPAVIHCSAGKDRTGVAVALVLAAVGVDDTTIAAEYAAGSDRVSVVMERLRTMPSYGDTVDRLPPLANITPPEYMLRFLAGVREQHGGVREFLLANGVTVDGLAHLREALTQPS